MQGNFKDYIEGKSDICEVSDERFILLFLATVTDFNQVSIERHTKIKEVLRTAKYELKMNLLFRILNMENGDESVLSEIDKSDSLKFAMYHIEFENYIIGHTDIYNIMDESIFLANILASDTFIFSYNRLDTILNTLSKDREIFELYFNRFKVEYKDYKGKRITKFYEKLCYYTSK